MLDAGAGTGVGVGWGGMGSGREGVVSAEIPRVSHPRVPGMG